MSRPPQRLGCSKGYSREAVLIICGILLIVMFGITALVSRLYHDRIQKLAQEWFARGEAAFRPGDTKTAITDYRNALVYAPNNSVFQLHLAQALAAQNHLEEARSYLINLLAVSPGNGEINLELARISAHQGEWLDAIRYYHSAIYGVWETDPLEMRWNVRRELCEYLLDRGDVSDAQPDVIALAQEVPMGNLKRQEEVGAFLLRAGLWQRGLEEFQTILRESPQDQDAILGVAIASYQLSDYSQALDYFDKLHGEKPLAQNTEEMLQTSQQIEAANPFRRGLDARKRAKRTVSAVVQASSRLAECAHDSGQALSATPPATPLQKLYATAHSMERQWTESNLDRHSDRVDAAMSLVFEMESAAAQQCGEPKQGADRILWLLGRSREGSS